MKFKDKYDKYKNKYLKMKVNLIGGDNTVLCNCKSVIADINNDLIGCDKYLSKIINNKVIIDFLDYYKDKLDIPQNNIYKRIELILRIEYIDLNGDQIVNIFDLLFNHYKWYTEDPIFLFLFSENFNEIMNNYLENNITDIFKSNIFNNIVIRIIKNIYNNISILSNYDIFKKIFIHSSILIKPKLYFILMILKNEEFKKKLDNDNLITKCIQSSIQNCIKYLHEFINFNSHILDNADIIELFNNIIYVKN